MPNRVEWSPRLSVGNETLDAQHRDILAQCNALANCLDDASEESDGKFDEIFSDLMSRALEHFSTEEELLTHCGYPDLDDHRSEQEEYGFLATEIVTAENFDRSELQTFLALWWAGHVMGSAKKHRDFLSK
jgi:hemerythrin